MAARDPMTPNERTQIDDVACTLEKIDQLLTAITDCYQGVPGIGAHMAVVQLLVGFARDRLPQGH